MTEATILQHFDTTIHLSDLIIFGGGISAFLKVFLSIRDWQKEIARTVGTEEPPRGLAGDMVRVKRKLNEHHEWLIRTGADQHGSGRPFADRQTDRQTE